MQTLPQRLAEVHKRIHTAERQFNRIPDSVQLLAVSKMQPPEVVEQAYESGQTQFGENYLQEALNKIRTLADRPIQWHFIGQVQSNKTHALAEHFDWVHSIDRYKIAKRLNDQRPENFKPLNVCLQIKLENEAGKGGVEPQSAAELARAVAELPALRLRGLMAIPPATGEPAAQRQRFARLREILQTLNRQGLALDTLSMGMSADLEAAIAEGATLVRVGTAIFGPRPKFIPGNQV